MAHAEAMLRNSLAADFKRLIIDQGKKPLQPLDEVNVVACLGEMPRFNTGYKGRVIDVWDSEGKNLYSATPVIIFTVNSSLGMGNYYARREYKQKKFRKKYWDQALPKCFDLQKEFNETSRHGCGVYEHYHNERRVRQCGVFVPITRPYWHSKGRIYTEPNTEDLVAFNKFLQDKGFITDDDAKGVFSARVRHLTSQLQY